MDAADWHLLNENLLRETSFNVEPKREPLEVSLIHVGLYLVVMQPLAAVSF